MVWRTQGTYANFMEQEKLNIILAKEIHSDNLRPMTSVPNTQ
jgi:hypothetical protein